MTKKSNKSITKQQVNTIKLYVKILKPINNIIRTAKLMR